MTTSRSLLPLVLATINTTLTSLKAPNSNPLNAEAASETSTVQIRSDFLTLLSLLSKQSTNYTLALKNPPEEKAAFQTLEKIKDGVEKFKFLEELLRARPGELDKRLRWALSESLESLSSFLSLSSSYLPPNPTSTSSASRQQLLSSCKTFWKVVESIEKDLPRNELEAVRKSWKDVTGLLEDCEGEIKELVEGGSNRNGGLGEDEEEEEDHNEEEEEIEELSDTQKSIILTSHSLLRLSRLLIVRILALTDSTSTTSTIATSSSKFDSLPFLSNLTNLIKQISEKADDLAGALEEVEDVEDEPSLGAAIEKVSEEIVEIGEKVATEIEAAATVSNGLAVEDGDKERIKKLEEWFKVWRLQRSQAQQKLKGLLRQAVGGV